MSPEKQAQAQNLVATGQKARAMILKVQPSGKRGMELRITQRFLTKLGVSVGELVSVVVDSDCLKLRRTRKKAKG